MAKVLCRSIVSDKATATYHKILNCIFPELYPPNSTRARPLHQDPLTKACGRTYGTNFQFFRSSYKIINYRQSFLLRECTWTEATLFLNAHRVPPQVVKLAYRREVVLVPIYISKKVPVIWYKNFVSGVSLQFYVIFNTFILKFLILGIRLIYLGGGAGWALELLRKVCFSRKFSSKVSLLTVT